MTTLRIRFGADMPAAAVEVVSPEFDVVDRVLLTAGQSKVVDVPSDASFLRVYLPSGQAVTLEDPGNLDREVTLRGLTRRGRKGESDSWVEPDEVTTFSQLRRYHKARSSSDPSLGVLQADVPLGTQGVARLQRHDGAAIPGGAVGRGREAHWDVACALPEPPLRLTIEQASGERLDVRLPADVRRVWARADTVRDQSSIALSVRVSTDQPTADTCLGYLHRGDLDSADVMAEWIDDAREMLREKMEDAYAACIGAYLLLRLRRFEEMRDWAKNLADRFAFIPDGCVIWATQLQYERTGNVEEIRQYLLKGAERGLPVYSEGLRLLIDGLRVLGDQGAQAREAILADAGAVLWTSPFTASIHASPAYTREPPAIPVAYDIALAAKA